LRSAPRNFKCGADRLRHGRLVGHLMLLPESPLALTLHKLLLVFAGFPENSSCCITKSACGLVRNTSSWGNFLFVEDRSLPCREHDPLADRLQLKLFLRTRFFARQMLPTTFLASSIQLVTASGGVARR
jgi:hypothetical protein